MTELVRDTVFKVVVVGSSRKGYGISSFVQRYADGLYRPNSQQIYGVDFKVKMMKEKDGTITKLMVWLPPNGCERFRNITHSYYRGSNAIILAFDLTNRESFDELEYWIEDVQKKVVLNSVDGPILTLVGTKCDMMDKRQITEDEAAAWARKHKISSYHETSAKENIGIDETFNTIVDLLYLKKSKPWSNPTPVTLIKEKKTTLFSCC
ncbi:hypothetical protein DFA_01927 [Cavenderia fasciculata]|uniref:Rab GTPase n=1 Tax=Cavenderia fasciculata TaxID=261658 RepID=F4PQT0_CACFS|nr:uncharacterized protein DFA_01927 [Cavenderia fasciculata]EGG22038.1 hypothetical protein DFA_01927 [Cavenderia fasciculata]|eukprot:XP_004359889.1 hypothetical protein DFA_01927 [Cavenderia fasciculata]